MRLVGRPYIPDGSILAKRGGLATAFAFGFITTSTLGLAGLRTTSVSRIMVFAFFTAFHALIAGRIHAALYALLSFIHKNL